MIKARQLRGTPPGHALELATAAITTRALDNVFNPSMHVDDRRVLVALRARAEHGSQGFDAHLVTVPFGGEPAWTDLSEHCARFGIGPVADPKLVALGNSLFCTFNNGHHRNGNGLFLVEIEPVLGPPRRCVYQDRRPIEKNWAFFRDAEDLYALYDLDPLTVLRCTDADSRALRFDLVHVGRRGHPTRTAIGLRQEWSIGTQPIPVGDSLRLIAHRKLYVRGRRAYVGYATEVTAPASSPRLRLSGAAALHHWTTSFGPARRHNPNLLSATYFSGLCDLGDQVGIGYGVNDVGYRLTQLAWESLW